MRRIHSLAAALVCLLLVASNAGAVGVSDSGTYKVYDSEKQPAAPLDAVRIIPPPTGGELQVRIRTDLPRYHVGNSIQITFGVNRDSYVFIFDTDSAGMTRMVFPNYYDQQNFLRAGKVYYIPDRGYDLEITPPSGSNTLSIVAVEQNLPFLAEFHKYSRKEPYPAFRDGATQLVRRIESFRTEPSAMERMAIRPAPRESIWATDSASYYVMDRYRVPPTEYKVPRFGWLDVDTYPSNARIYIDGNYFGRSPQVIDRLEIGYHRILLEKEGYLPYECNVYIKGNETKHLDTFLKETPIQPGFSRSQNPVKGFDGFGFFKRSPQPQQ